MTIDRMIKELTALREKVGPRSQVFVPFTGQSLDYWKSTKVEIKDIVLEVDGTFENKDGSEKWRRVVVIE